MSIEEARALDLPRSTPEQFFPDGLPEGFTADQVAEYAGQFVSCERERCPGCDSGQSQWTAMHGVGECVRCRWPCVIHPRPIWLRRQDNRPSTKPDPRFAQAQRPCLFETLHPPPDGVPTPMGATCMCPKCVGVCG